MRPTVAWSVRTLLLCALAVAAFLAQAGAAQAAYPVQPYDGKVLDTTDVAFLVSYEPTDFYPRVYVSRSPTPGPGGSLLLGPGLVGSCTPTTSFGEQGKYTCTGRLSEGAYYWQFKYEKYECTTFFGVPFCAYKSYFGPIWRFEVKLAALPTTLPVMGGPSTRSRFDPKYARIASQISGKPTQVICWNAAEWNSIHVRRRADAGEGLSWVLGYVRRGTAVVNLAPAVCDRLDLLAYRGARPRGRARVEFAEAVDTLAHEAIHVGGISDEAITECYSLQFMDWTAMQLGTNYAYARSMTGLAWNVLYGKIPVEYRTPDCYDGGPLDLLPASALWP